MRVEIGAVVWLDFQLVFIEVSERADLQPLSDSGPILRLIDGNAPSHIDTNGWTFLVSLAHHWRYTFWAELHCISIAQVNANGM